MPASPVNNGSDTAGRPVSDHSEQNAGLPVAVPLGATPVRRRRQDGVVLLEYLGDAGGVAPRVVARRQIPDRGHLASLSQKIAQLLAGRIAAAFDHLAQIVRHVGGHDGALVVPGCGIGVGQIDHLGAIAQSA